MDSQTWGTLILTLGVMSRTVLAASSDRELPFWSIILICMGCILVMMTLLTFLCIYCILSRPSMQRQNAWVRSYFPHLAFGGRCNEEPSSIVYMDYNAQDELF